MAWDVTNSADPTGLTDAPGDSEYTIERGIITDLVWEGPKSEVDTKFAEMIALGYSPVRRTHVGGNLWRVVAQNVPTDASGDPAPVTPDDQITTVWTCPGNMLEKDLWDLPKIKAALDQVRAYYSATPDKGIQAVGFLRKLVDMWVAGETTVTYNNVDGVETTANLTAAGIRASLLAVGVDSTHAGYVVSLMESMARGTTKFPVSQWVAKRVATGPLTSSLRGVRLYTNRMVTSDYLVEVEGMPSNLLDEIPDGYWLKQTPSVDRVGALLQVTNEWWWAEDYDRFSLGDPVDAPP